MNTALSHFFKRHTPAILCVIASGGVIATAVLTAQNTTKANVLIQEAKEKKGEELTTVEKLQTVAPAYIPAIISGAATIACLFSALLLNRKQQVSLASAYGIVNSQYKRYSQKVRELFGNEAHESVMEAIAVEKSKEPDISAPSLMENGSLAVEGVKEEKLLFFDAFSERYFESTLSHVLQAEYHLNRNLSLGGDVTLNDFYLFLGIDKIDCGDDLGWSWYEYELPWIDFEHVTSQTDDGRRYVMICTMFGPEHLYSEPEE